MTEHDLIASADQRARDYLASSATRRVFPDEPTIDRLATFDEPFFLEGRPAEETLALLDRVGSPATVASNGPRYFGFVIGATLPIAAAAERLALAWDQCASSFETSPASARIEEVAAKWVLDALDLPRDSAVAFGTSATACGLSCLAAAQRALLTRRGWDVEGNGLRGAPEIKVVVSEAVHVTVRKALRLLGFGMNHLVVVPTDEHGRIDLHRVPPMDDMTILCLQAGEVNSGEFDPFEPIVARARTAGAWVHVDGAFGLWARVSAATRHLTLGVDRADSWTVDGHKWLNTPYDGGMAICRDADLLAAAMNSDAVYATSSKNAQKNLGIEFSRRARGVPIWAALRTLGKGGMSAMVDQHCRQARDLAEGLRRTGYEVVNRVVLNQVLVRADSDDETTAIRVAAQNSGEIWFGSTIWRGTPALRLSVSSWRTTDADIERTIDLLAKLKASTNTPV